jgi:arginyl-tRNA synthetase
MPVDAAILAGGQARRFGGRDKSALRIGAASILDRQLSALREAAGRVFMVTASRARFGRADLEVVEDLLPGTGAAGGLYTALQAARSPFVLVLACDLPFVSAAFLRYLASLASPGYDAIVPRSADGWQPLCAVYGRHVAVDLRARIEAGRLKLLDALASWKVREVGPPEIEAAGGGEHVFLNVNTPGDLARASGLLHAAGPSNQRARNIPMILPVHGLVRSRIASVLQERYGLAPADVPAVAINYPPSRELGDLAVPVAFELARRLRKAPKAIAEDIAGALGGLPGFSRVEATNGYLNLFLDRPAFVLERLDAAAGPGPDPAAVKTVVEHTAINPNKAAHIGHLRNAALGDTLVRTLRFRGTPVEVQNYIDDTGVQVADVVVGFRELEKMDFEGVRKVADTTRFDYYCWDLYARVADWYAVDKARLAARGQALHDIERGGNEAAAIAGFVADRIVRCHLRTMARMNVGYDLLAWEGDILRLHFWARAFEVLKAQGAVYLQTQGRLAGCWVMRIQDDGRPDAADSGREAEPAADTGAGTGEDDAEPEKVIVRSNGTVTYVGKDMAYQFWKFGLLGRDFHYRRFETAPDGHQIWATSTDGGDDETGRPRFGGAGAVFNVIDVRQSYLQKLLKQALAAIGHPGEAERSSHFSYEMVALTHNTARQLGYELSPEDAARPFVEVSGRKGLGVKADDLLDIVTRKAGEEIARRPENADLEATAVRGIAEAIGIAAVRYFMIRFSRGKVIAFDIDEALNFQGETGPYLQYAVVRANNIFQKLKDREGVGEAEFLATLPDVATVELTGEAHGHDLWAMVLEAARLDEVAEQAVRTLEFSVLAKWAFGLAQMFNAFYHRYPILNEERDDARRWRAAAVRYFRNQLTGALDLMGIPVPPRM